MESLYNLWAKRNAYYEEEFYDSIVDAFCQYTGGSSEGQVSKGKTFNAGYEVFIYVFFLGLYYGERRPLNGKTKTFGQPVGMWGNVTQKGRKSYGKIRQYIFAALVAKTDIDFIGLDKGDVQVEDAVSALMQTMNEYANTGFYLMKEKMQTIPDFFFSNQGFLNYILKYCSQ